MNNVYSILKIKYVDLTNYKFINLFRVLRANKLEVLEIKSNKNEFIILLRGLIKNITIKEYKEGYLSSEETIETDDCFDLFLKDLVELFGMEDNSNKNEYIIKKIKIK